jgi:exonuclease SbcC
MIIRGIHAINVLKYAELRFENLPTQGLIAISGPNESGKSTIGETICFALFGRTFSLQEDDLDKVVRWSESQCSVTLTFAIKDEIYQLSRFLDEEGNHSARLTREGDKEPLVRGVDRVAATLTEKLGFEFEEFIESFYLAQREITTPHPHSHAVKIMAGVAPMEQLTGEFAAEIRDLEEKLAELSTETETAEQELVELELEEGHLLVLDDRRTRLDQLFRDNKRLCDELNEAATQYVDRVPEIRSAERAAGSASAFRWLSLLLSLICGGAWALLSLAADLAASQQLLAWLKAAVPSWQVSYLPIAAYASVGFLLLTLLFWIRAGRQKAKAAQLREQAGHLVGPLAKVQQVEEDQGLEVSGAEGQQLAKSASTARPSRPELAQFEATIPRVKIGRASAREASQIADRESAWLKDLLERQSHVLHAIDQAIEEETERVQQAAKLHEVIDSLTGSKLELLDRMAQRMLAIELLEGAARQSSRHFNRDIRDLVGNTLPLFTAGRYEHLKISESLSVQVFSAEKRDFLDLDEVSSGTQRQIMLALRLALSEKLLKRTVKGQQFAFLDEPFAFFDAGRTRKALEALNERRGDITQIWIVAQSFPEGVQLPFAANINCDREFDSLELLV